MYVFVFIFFILIIYYPYECKSREIFISNKYTKTIYSIHRISFKHNFGLLYNHITMDIALIKEIKLTNFL